MKGDFVLGSRAMRFALAVLVGLWSAAVSAEPWDITPPPRGQWALDQTNRVSSATLSEVNRLSAALDASGAGQLGLLVIDTTRGIKARDFATGVFNSWGVGHAGANDGVLLFFALSDRKSEIILGDGSKVRSGQTDVVMRDDVVANMKRGDLDAAILRAAHSLEALMRRAAGKPAAPSPGDNQGLGGTTYVTPVRDTPMSDDHLAPFVEGGKSFPERSPRTWVVDLGEVLNNSQRAQLDVAASDIYSANQGRVFFLVVNSKGPYPTLNQLVTRLQAQVRPLSKLPVAIVALDVGQEFSAIVRLPEGVVTNVWESNQVAQAQQALLDSANVDRVAGLLAAQRFAQQAIVTGIPPRPMSDALRQGFERNLGAFQFGGVGLLIGGLLFLKRWNRKRVRHCEHCKNARQLLGDAAEDQHLDRAQLKEESIGSVDYDVWWCGRCQDVLVLRYGAFFTSYSKCPQCSARTLSSTTTTITHATEYSGGLQRIDERCENCSHTNSYTRTTARITRSSSSSGSSWSSSSSSSSSSFGGGSSSGGGSSGSW